jgi:hypothetical protein
MHERNERMRRMYHLDIAQEGEEERKKLVHSHQMQLARVWREEGREGGREGRREGRRVEGLCGGVGGDDQQGHIWAYSKCGLATKESVTAAHNKCLNALIDAIIKHKKKKSNIVFIKEDTDVTFKTAWQNSELPRICIAQQIEQAAVQVRQNLNSNEDLDRHINEEDIEQLWRRRPDRIAINRDKRIIYIIEFKRTMDLRPSFQAKAEDRANRQHEWLTKPLTRAVAEKGWEVQTVIFTGGTMGSVKIGGLQKRRVVY